MDTFKTFANAITDLIGNTITNLLLTAAVAAFMYSVVTFIWNRSHGNVDAMKDAQNRLLWSIIGLFVMFSIWGIVGFFQDGIFGPGGAKNTIKAPSISASVPAGSPAGSSPAATVNCASYRDSSSCNAQAKCLWDGRLGGTCNAI